MRIYLAMAGEYSDRRVVAAFVREEDARSYELADADDVEEYELHEGPVEVRGWHEVRWWPHLADRDQDDHHAANPYWNEEPRDFDGQPRRVEHRWSTHPSGDDLLVVGGWDRQRVMKVYSEQRAQYIATADLRGERS